MSARFDAMEHSGVATSWRMDESVLQLSCIKDEGRPLGIALQEEISNHHKLH